MDNIFSLRISKNKVLPTIQMAGGLAIFISIFSLIIFFVFIIKDLSDSLSIILFILTPVLLLLLGVGVLFKNRFSAIVLIVVYVIDRILSTIFSAISGNERAAIIAGIMGVFFTMYFIRGAKATFVYHKHIKNKK